MQTNRFAIEMKYIYKIEMKHVAVCIFIKVSFDHKEWENIHFVSKYIITLLNIVGPCIDSQRQRGEQIDILSMLYTLCS